MTYRWHIRRSVSCHKKCYLAGCKKLILLPYCTGRHYKSLLKYSGSCHLQQILSVISQSTEIGQVDQQLTAEDLGKGVVGLNYLLKQWESVNFTQGVVVKTLLWWLSSFSLMLFNIIEKSHKMIANDECNCSATNLSKEKKNNGISVAMEEKLIYIWDKMTLPKTTFIQYPFFTKRFPVHSTKKYLSIIID